MVIAMFFNLNHSLFIFTALSGWSFQLESWLLIGWKNCRNLILPSFMHFILNLYLGWVYIRQVCRTWLNCILKWLLRWFLLCIMVVYMLWNFIVSVHRFLEHDQNCYSFNWFILFNAGILNGSIKELFTYYIKIIFILINFGFNWSDMLSNYNIPEIVLLSILWIAVCSYLIM